MLNGQCSIFNGQCSMLNVLLTIWAPAFDDVVGGGHFISIGQINKGDFYVIQTKGLMTMLTKEMHVNVIIVFMAETMAQFIAHTISSVLDDMDEMMLLEEVKSTEDARLVNGQNLCFQLTQRHRTVASQQGINHDNAIGCGFDAMRLHQFYRIVLIHGCVLSSS